jgi:hypothetical protein
MKKRRLFSIVLVFILLFAALPVFADSSNFNELLGTGSWGGTLDVSDTVVAAETNLYPIPPTTNLSAEVNGVVWYIDYSGSEYYLGFYEYQDYIDSVSSVLVLPTGAKKFIEADSYHYGYINGSCDNNYLYASN